MPISLLPSNSQSLQMGAATPQDARPVKDSRSTQDADSPPGTEPTTGGTSEASSIVTLSPAAQIIASANAKNIEFSTTSLLVVSGAPEAAEVAKAAAVENGQFTRPYDQATHQYSGAISLSGLESAGEELGGNRSVADALFKYFDTNGNDSISDAELYTALSATISNSGSPNSQALMQFTDANGDGSISMTEYANVEEALTNAEEPTLST
jgi:hypothetical protein